MISKIINIASHIISKIRFYSIFKVKFTVKVTSTTSMVIMFRPGMAGLLALSWPNFSFKYVIFEQNDPTFPNLLWEIDVCLQLPTLRYVRKNKKSRYSTFGASQRNQIFGLFLNNRIFNYTPVDASKVEYLDFLFFLTLFPTYLSVGS